MARLYTYYSNSNTNVPTPPGSGTGVYDHRYYLDYTYTQNLTANTSTIIGNLYMEFAGSQGFAGTPSGEILIDGTWQTVSPGYLAGQYTLIHLGTYTKTVSHNTDGTKTIYIQAGGLYGPARYTAYTQLVLPTIPRVSSITNDTNASTREDFGDTTATNVVFSISRYDSAFTHTLKYTVGGTTYTIGTGITTSKSYTFPTSLISNFPSSAEPTITVTCETYNGATYIGSSNTTVYLKVPTSYVPTCSLALSDDNSITTAWGIWVKSQSILRGVITASGVSGSTISSYLSTLESENRSGTPFTKTLQTSGSVEVISTVTDTRGRTAQDSETITVVDYTVPTFVSIAVKRCLVDGTLDEFGTYGKVVCEYAISPCSNNNAKSLVVNLGATVKTFTLSSYSGTYTALTSELFSGLAIDTTYNFTFKLIDSFYDATTTEKTVSQSYSVLPSFVLESDHNGGDGKCLGRIATRPGFDVYLNSTFFGEFYSQNVADGWFKSNNELSYISGTNRTFTLSSLIDNSIQKSTKLRFKQNQSLTAYWNLDSNANSQVGTFNGTETAITHSAGKFGNCAVFNGSTSKIILTDNALLKPTGAFTVGCWFKTGVSGTSKVLFNSVSYASSIYSGFQLWIPDTTNKLRAAIGNNTGITSGVNFMEIDSTTTVCDNQWHYGVMTFDGIYTKIYLDGKLESFSTTPAPVYAGTNYVRIGCANGIGTDGAFFNGSIDDMFLINGYALDEKTIYDKYISQTVQGTGDITITKYCKVLSKDNSNNLFVESDSKITNSIISEIWFSNLENPLGYNAIEKKYGREFYLASDAITYSDAILFFNGPTVDYGENVSSKITSRSDGLITLAEIGKYRITLTAWLNPVGTSNWVLINDYTNSVVLLDMIQRKTNANYSNISGTVLLTTTTVNQKVSISTIGSSRFNDGSGRNKGTVLLVERVE